MRSSKLPSLSCHTRRRILSEQHGTELRRWIPCRKRGCIASGAMFWLLCLSIYALMFYEKLYIFFHIHHTCLCNIFITELYTDCYFHALFRFCNTGNTSLTQSALLQFQSMKLSVFLVIFLLFISEWSTQRKHHNVNNFVYIRRLNSQPISW